MTSPTTALFAVTADKRTKPAADAMIGLRGFVSMGRVNDGVNDHVTLPTISGQQFVDPDDDIFRSHLATTFHHRADRTLAQPVTSV